MKRYIPYLFFSLGWLIGSTMEIIGNKSDNLIMFVTTSFIYGMIMILSIIREGN